MSACASREDSIKMKFKETGCDGVDWIHVFHDKDRWLSFVNTVMDLRAL